MAFTPAGGAFVAAAAGVPAVAAPVEEATLEIMVTYKLSRTADCTAPFLPGAST